MWESPYRRAHSGTRERDEETKLDMMEVVNGIVCVGGGVRHSRGIEADHEV